MNSQKIPVGILGATGSVGQKFIELLTDHPWFEIAALAASDRSAGKKYKDAARWFQTSQLDDQIAEMTVQKCEPGFDCKIVFSGLDSSVAGDIETDFADAGYIVVSNAKNHRMDPDVPLLVPEVNYEHIQMINQQDYGDGMIITNPNCSTIGMVLALKPLLDEFGVESAHVVTLQALSGAGYPGVPSLDIIDNVIPHIGGEEDKMETEPLKIFGKYQNGSIENLAMTISAQCNRVAVIHGHTECLSVKLQQNASREDLIQAWNSFQSEPQRMQLPTAPTQPTLYLEELHYPQPKLHRNLDKGMVATIGKLQECPLLDFKFVVLSHNTIRGAAGGAVLNAEYLVATGFVDGLEIPKA